MYFSAVDIHTAHQSNLDLFHKVSKGYLDSLEGYFNLASDFTKNLLTQGGRHLESLSEDGAVSSWLEKNADFQRRLLQHDLPEFISHAIHTSSACAVQVMDSAEHRVNGTRGLVDKYFERSLQSAPWETSWLIKAAEKGADQSLDTADQLSAAAIAETKLIDAELQSELTAPPPRKARKRSVAA